MLYSHKELKRVSRGFTLIELLVVVLIIGILAAIALPQYMKSIRLSRASQAVIMLNAILKGQEEYYLIHGEYTDNIEDLTITIPPEKLGSKMSGEDKKSNYYYFCFYKRTCAALMNNIDYPGFEFTGSQDSVHKEKKWCQLSNGQNQNARAICETMGTVDTSYGGGDYYLLK